MSGNPLPVRHVGSKPVRHVGSKDAKLINRIDAVERLDRIGCGKGGFREDRGYQWYGGL